MAKKQVIGRPVVMDGKTYPVSRAVRAGDFVFTHGLMPFERDGTMTDGPIEAQAKVCLKRVKEVLAEAGCGLADVIKATVWLSDPADFDGFNAVWRSFFPKEPPARATVRGELMLTARCEVEVVAYKPAGHAGPMRRRLAPRTRATLLPLKPVAKLAPPKRAKKAKPARKRAVKASPGKKAGAKARPKRGR